MKAQTNSGKNTVVPGRRESAGRKTVPGIGSGNAQAASEYGKDAHLTELDTLANNSASNSLPGTSGPATGLPPAQAKARNNTGLPDTLKSGIEHLSGISMDDVKVHYNSDKPSTIQAHAYAQGTDIHLGAGQEKHLPHEAWHLVQQKQGRVRPTIQLKGNVNVNDDKSLEKEADAMGGKALQMKARPGSKGKNLKSTRSGGLQAPIQRLAFFSDNGGQAMALPPAEEIVWVTPLLGINHALYAGAAQAEAAVRGNLGVAGAPANTAVTNANPASAGSYDFWYNNAVPNVLKGMPTHNTDPTNILFKVTPTSINTYTPVIHKHAADYPGINIGNAWAVMANPLTPYNQNAGAFDHYLEKPANAKSTEKIKKLPLKSTKNNDIKNLKDTFELIGKGKTETLK